MNIFQLEDRLKQFPSSALAVRLAGLYVARFRIEEVFKLCLESIQRHPNYSTSYLILGRGYAALRQYEAAILCGEKVLSLQPDSLLAHNLITNWRQIILTNREKKTFESFNILSAPTIEELQKILNDGTVKPETVINQIEPNEVVESPTVETSQSEKGQTSIENNTPFPEIVSATLAEIYTKQGEYDEAIKMYRALILQRPKQKDSFEKRILILEEKLKYRP